MNKNLALWIVLVLTAQSFPVLAGSADEVIAAERAFAADAARHGWVAAFKTYAAPDAVVFRLNPVNAQESLASQPDEPADTSLKWWPVWAGIARSGDLGFTTGPYSVGGKAFGHYFTVWAKQPDGTWRWIFDGGPRNDAASSLGPETEPMTLPIEDAVSNTPEKAWAEVAALEAVFAKDATDDLKSAYMKRLPDDARVMGSPAQPATNRQSRIAELDRRPPTMKLTPLGGRASAAGDLVFTFGAGDWNTDGDAHHGHYVRIWQKRKSGWALAFDELLAAPPPKKPS